MPRFIIDKDIKKAETLPSSFYKDPEVFELLGQKVFQTTWHWVGEEKVFDQSNINPLMLYEGFMDEPLLLTRDESDELSCMANVCTHRANILTQIPKNAKSIVCPYHGRKFDLTGNYVSMPEFGEAIDFPRPCDSLKRYSLKQWQQFLFTSINPSFDFEDIAAELHQRVGFLPMREFKYRSELSKEYLVNAHWALYCDNYLEGFHIPFVHKDLNAALDYGNYETLLFDHFNLQVGYGSSGEDVFDLPDDHVDAGKNIAAYYYWIFPNLMLNFYPWGLSINVVCPIGLNRTKVKFITYVYDDSKLDKGAGALLDKVEREDEFVVEGVQKGITSSGYSTGRFSPTREKGVHHFHRLLSEFLG